MLLGRLGLESASILHSDRHGLLYLEYGSLYVEDGTLHFLAATSPSLQAGDYTIPYQMVSMIMLGPGSNVSHDALRLMARHGTLLMAVGHCGTRLYTAVPFGPGDSAVARRQVSLWADASQRLFIARKMYAKRLDEVFPEESISALRGMEGARMKVTYQQLALKYQISWKGRRYDRQNPGAADIPNQCINHAATTVEAAAMLAVAATGTVPQLGFIHEDAHIAFCLDIADLFRHSITIPIAFSAAKMIEQDSSLTPDKAVRSLAAEVFKKKKVIAQMIDAVKYLFE
jgi:CRISPR-associated protein Cas1